MKNEIIHITEIRKIKNNKIVDKFGVDFYISTRKLPNIINKYDNIDFSYKIIKIK